LQLRLIGSGMSGTNLADLLGYDSETGIVYWKADRAPGIKAGDKAGTKTVYGYTRIGIAGKDHMAHRIAWFLAYGEYPNGFLDHINGDRSDNRLANLRIASKAENGWNAKKSKANTSGFKGVYWHKKLEKWHAGICVKGKHISLGFYPSPYMAHNAYKFATGLLFREFANHG